MKNKLRPLSKKLKERVEHAHKKQMQSLSKTGKKKILNRKRETMRKTSDQYLQLAENQQRVDQAIKYDIYVLGLYICVGIFIGMVLVTIGNL